MVDVDQIEVEGIDELEAFDASTVEARENPRLYADMLIAAGGRAPMPHPVHALIHAVFKACYCARKHLAIEAPPELGKTTQVLPLLVWLLGAISTRLRIGVICRKFDATKKRMIRIRKALMSAVTRAVFPHVIPDDRASTSKGAWTHRVLYLRGHEDAAVTGYGLFEQGEGERLDLAFFDDICTREGLRSPAERDEVKSALHDTWLYRLTDDGIAILLNNTWHEDDAFQRLKTNPSFCVLRIAYEGVEKIVWEIFNAPAGWEGETRGEMELWAVWPKERLEKKRAEDERSYRRSFEGKTLRPEECRFVPRAKWARYRVGGEAWKREGLACCNVAYLDPSGGKSVKKGDFAAFVVVRAWSDGIIDVLEPRVERAEPEVQVRWPFDRHEELARSGQGGLRMVELEMLAKERKWIEPLFESERELRRKASNPYWQLAWRIDEPTENKDSIIDTLGGPLQNGWIRWPENLENLIAGGGSDGQWWRNLVEQVEVWPMGDHDDGPDALAKAYRLSRGMMIDPSEAAKSGGNERVGSAAARSF